MPLNLLFSIHFRLIRDDQNMVCALPADHRKIDDLPICVSRFYQTQRAHIAGSASLNSCMVISIYAQTQPSAAYRVSQFHVLFYAFTPIRCQTKVAYLVLEAQ